MNPYSVSEGFSRLESDFAGFIEDGVEVLEASSLSFSKAEVGGTEKHAFYSQNGKEELILMIFLLLLHMSLFWTFP